MSSPDLKKYVPSAGEQKIEEYSQRIENGESVDKVTEGLPESFRAAIDQKITERKQKQELRVQQEQPEIEKLRTELAPNYLDEINQKYSEVYFAKKSTNELHNDTFLVAKGINPETDQPFELVDGSVGEHYDSHGLAKDGQLDKLLNLLSNGIDSQRIFFSAPFTLPDSEDRAGIAAAMGTSSGEAYKDGIAVVTADYDKKLTQDGIKYVFINDVYQNLKEPLSKQFSQYEFHLLSEQAQVLKKKE